MKNIDLMHIEPLDLYIGKPYQINDQITILQPTLGQVVDYGENSYWGMVHTLCATTSDFKVRLFDAGINWMEISNFELFSMVAPSLPVEQTSILLGDLDLSSMKTYRNRENGEIILASEEQMVKIDRLIYERIMNCIRKMHGFKPNNDKAHNKATMRAMIESERQAMEVNSKKEPSSYLLPLISSVRCKMGWTKDYILQEGICSFFDTVNRLNVIDNADHLMSGIYQGTVDAKKISRENLNWMRELK